MSPRKRIHADSAARMAAHRARLKQNGRVALNITVAEGTAGRIRAEAKACGCTLGEALEARLPTQPQRRKRGEQRIALKSEGGASLVLVDGETVARVWQARVGWAGELLGYPERTASGRTCNATVKRLLALRE